MTMSYLSKMSLKSAIMMGGAMLLIGIMVYSSFPSKESYVANNEFSDATDEVEKTYVMLFYADWCPHCVAAKPKWSAAKEMYDGKIVNGRKIVFVEYNCSDAQSPECAGVREKYDVAGFPTVKLQKDNQVVSFESKITTETLSEFINSA